MSGSVSVHTGSAPRREPSFQLNGGQAGTARMSSTIRRMKSSPPRIVAVEPSESPVLSGGAPGESSGVAGSNGSGSAVGERGGEARLYGVAERLEPGRSIADRHDTVGVHEPTAGVMIETLVP